MRITKWTKWQLGAVGAVGVAILFHQVKGSAAFAQAAADHHRTNEPAGLTAKPNTDGVVKEWQTSQGSSSSQPGGNSGTMPQSKGSRSGSSGTRPGNSGNSGNSGSPSIQNQQPSGSSGSTSTQPQTRTRHS